MPLPEQMLALLAKNKLDAAKLDPAILAVLDTLAYENQDSQKRDLRPYQLFAEDSDIAFHLDRELNTLWFKADQYLSQHIPEHMSSGGPLKEFFPKENYQSIVGLIENFKQNRLFSSSEFKLQCGATETIDYTLKLLEVENDETIILFESVRHKLSSERIYLDSIRQLEHFNHILVALNKQLNSKLVNKSLYDAIARAAKTATSADKVGIWFLSFNQQFLDCKISHCSAQGQAKYPTRIEKNIFPNFFKKLDERRTNYVRPKQNGNEDALSLYDARAIYVLEAPVRFEGRVIGLLRSEYFSQHAHITNNEHQFLASLADLCAQTHERLLKDQMERALGQSENRFKTLTEHSDTAIFAFDQNFLYVNPAFISLTGISAEKLKHAPIEVLFSKHFRTLHNNSSPPLPGKSLTRLENEVEITTLAGERRWLYVTTTRSTFDEKPCWLASAFDISERKISEARLKFQATHDQLTGLPNRFRFQERIGAALARASRDRFYKFAVLYINIDRFKIFNDSMGQLIGDQLLLELSKRISLCLERGSIAARISGDEFSVFIDDVMNEDNVLSNLKTIQAGIAEPLSFDGQETVCRGSIGVVIANHSYEKPEHIIRDASIAMYHAKKEDKLAYRFFTTEMHERARRVLETESELRLAIRRRTLELYYQPIVRLSNGSISYFEALIRWHKSSSTVVSPLDFIPLAEESGVILPLGRWIVEQAGEQLEQWQKNGWPDIGVSVNVSGKQFQAEEISEDVRKIVQAREIRERSLKIEITESSMIQNSETIQSQLQHLRSLGCDLLIDDFGTGYSSLSYLHKFPIDCIKIDRSFIASLGQEEDSYEIVRAISNLAHNLKLEVVAEGVETSDQLETLKEIGCDYAQGYFFSTPLRADEATEYLKSRLNAT